MTAGAGRPMPMVRFGARGLPADRAAVLAIVTGLDRGGAGSAAMAAMAAMSTVDRAVHEGADIIDIGVAEDTARIVPFVAAVRERYSELAISVDARLHEVARPVLEAGADILSWTVGDLTLAEIAAEHGCALVCRYSGRASRRTGRVPGTDVVRDVVDDLTAQAATLVGLGVPKETILIDPTHHVGADPWHGLELLRHCDDVVATGWPALLTLPDTDLLADAGVDDRLDGTLAATAIAAWAGIRVFRVHQVHQVRQTRRVLEMVASIAGIRPPARAIRGLSRWEPS